METLTQHPFFAMLVGGLLTLLFKFVWERYLRQSSRVTKDQLDEAMKAIRTECDLKRAPCVQQRASNKAYFEGLIAQQKTCLDEVYEEEEMTAKRRQDTRRVLICIMMTQLKLCEAMNQLLPGDAKKLDCTDISKLMVEMGIIE